MVAAILRHIPPQEPVLVPVDDTTARHRGKKVCPAPQQAAQPLGHLLLAFRLAKVAGEGKIRLLDVRRSAHTRNPSDGWR